MQDKMSKFQEHLETVRKERLEERRLKRIQERKEKARKEKQETRERALEEKRRRGAFFCFKNKIVRKALEFIKPHTKKTESHSLVSLVG